MQPITAMLKSPALRAASSASGRAGRSRGPPRARAREQVFRTTSRRRPARRSPCSRRGRARPRACASRPRSSDSRRSRCGTSMSQAASCAVWRRGRDLNPRPSYPGTRLAGGRTRPLCDPSARTVIVGGPPKLGHASAAPTVDCAKPHAGAPTCATASPSPTRTASRQPGASDRMAASRRGPRVRLDLDERSHHRPRGFELHPRVHARAARRSRHLAARTSHVTLGMSVLVVPTATRSSPRSTSRAVDVLSGGRLVLGVGIGWLEQEFAALGASYEERAAQTDEYLASSATSGRRRLRPTTGSWKQYDNMRMFPKAAPERRGTIPIWVGGNTRPAHRRAAPRRWLASDQHEPLGARGRRHRLPSACAALRDAPLDRSACATCRPAGRDPAGPVLTWQPPTNRQPTCAHTRPQASTSSCCRCPPGTWMNSSRCSVGS